MKIKIYIKKLKRRFINYWLGEVIISKHYIYCTDKKDRLHGFSIVVSKFNEATWFHEMETESIQPIIDILNDEKIKHLRLDVDYGNGLSQTYLFNKYQQNLLLKQLEDINKEDFYIENSEYED